MSTGSVTFSASVSGNYTIGTASFGVSMSGSFPSESYSISSASMSISRWRQYANSLDLIVTGNGAQLGSFNESQNETTHSISFSLITQSVYAGLSSISLSSSGSYNVGAIRDGAQITITVNWETSAPPEPTITYLHGPSSASINKTVTAPGGTATISWDNTVDGDRTSYIAGYKILRAQTNIAQSYEVIKTIAAPMSLSGSATVTASSNNGTLYYLKVAIYGIDAFVYTTSLGAGPVTLLATQASAPTSVTVSTATPSPGASFTLSWSGASGSKENAIVGYDIYRANTSGGSYSKVSSVTTTSPSGSLQLTAPTVIGTQYFYKVLTRGAAGNDCVSPLSTTYAGITVTKKSVNSPTSVSVSSSQAPPGSDVYLYWSGATPGDSQIIGYNIYRDTSAAGSFSTLLSQVDTGENSGGLLVQAPLSAGTTYYYKVQALSAQTGYEGDLSTATASVKAVNPTPIVGMMGRTNASGWY